MRSMRVSAIVQGAVAFFLLFICFWQSSDPGFGAPPTVRPFEMYEQWSGFESGFPGEPEFQFIRDYETWKQFWQKHKPDEFMPQIDLDRLMAFVWCPGPVLSGERLVEALRFYRDSKGLTLVVRTEIRRDSGAWQAPYLIAFLQKTSGHVRIVRPGSKARREPALMPLHVWQDMGLPFVYHPDSVSLQAPKRPPLAWKNPWELDIPNPAARPAWTKPPAPAEPVFPPVAASTQNTGPESATNGSTGAVATGSAAVASGSASTSNTSSSTSSGSSTGSSSGAADPTDIGTASGADPLQDPFNLDF